MNMTSLRAALLPLLCLCALAASAEETAAPVEQLDTVSVKLVRDASMIPYARINELLDGLQRHGQGLFRMEFRLKPNDPARPLQSPKLAVQHADAYIPIAVQPDGLFELPLLPREQAQDADLASNQPKGSLRVEAKLLLTTKPVELDMETVRRIVEVARTLRSELLPWYLRWLFPQIDGVRVCSAEPDWQLQWTEQQQGLGVPLAADPKDRDPDTAKGATSKPCTTLSGQERWPDAARLLAPPDAKLSVRLRS
jgi:hypothetical protein